MIGNITLEDAILEELQDTSFATAYLQAALDDYTENGDSEEFLRGLQLLAHARGGITKLAEDTGFRRQSLYKALSENGNPRLDTLSIVLQKLGFKLSLEPLA